MQEGRTGGATLRISKTVMRARTVGKKFAEPNEIRIRIRPQASISGPRLTLAHYTSATFILVYPEPGDGIGGGAGKGERALGGGSSTIDLVPWIRFESLAPVHSARKLWHSVRVAKNLGSFVICSTGQRMIITLCQSCA